MAGVRRWRFQAEGETYTVPLNPNAMTPLFPTRAITARPVVHGDKVLLFEGSTPPTNWQFSGDILDEAHHEALRHWVYDITQRVMIRDHYGRDIECVLTQFEPVPKRALNRPWRHTYTIRALVLKVGAPSA